MSDSEVIDKNSDKGKRLLRIHEGYGTAWTRTNYSDGSKFISVVAKLHGGQIIQFKLWPNKEKWKETHPDWIVKQAEKLTFKSSQFMDTDWLRRESSPEEKNLEEDTPHVSYISSDSQAKPNGAASNQEGTSPK